VIVIELPQQEVRGGAGGAQVAHHAVAGHGARRRYESARVAFLAAARVQVVEEYE
jgi:hypothetical protein